MAKLFQLTPARSGRPKRAGPSVPCSMFQLTPARSGRLAIPRRRVFLHGFNSRPREAGDARRKARVRVGVVVSTHARAKRATWPCLALNDLSGFQLTPARSGRRAPSSGPRDPKCFNSRPREAGDSSADASHSPWPGGFNSRPREAGDTHHVSESPKDSCFNSRPREAGDSVVELLRLFLVGFNSRPREAGDMGSAGVEMK